jgi:hypothetical protein
MGRGFRIAAGMPAAAPRSASRFDMTFGGDLMLVRLGFCIVLSVAVLMPGGARAADCAQEISRLMSKTTERLTTRFNRVTKQIQKQGATKRLRAEECRIARQLKPRLENQLAALKQSSCVKDPQMGLMIADIVRGHEDDLALARKSVARSECR